MNTTRIPHRIRIMLQRFISLTLVLCLSLGTLTEVLASAVDTEHIEIIAPIEYGPDIVTYPYTMQTQAASIRSLSELRAIDGVTIDDTGTVTKIAVSDNALSADEIQLLFGLSSESEGKNASFLTAGLAEGVFTQGAELHGNNNILVRELAALANNAEFDSLDDATYSNIETLICSGYSYRQARAAVVAAEMFGITIDELCAAKIEELTADEDESDSSSYTIKVVDSVSTENEEYKTLAIRLGIPYSLVEAKLNTATKITTADVLSEFNTAMRSTYAPLVMNDDLTLSPNPSLATPAATTSSTPEVSYQPEKVLANPFDYKTTGNFSINLTNLDYLYTETDLSLPGVNGLDLEINRIFTSAFADTQIPNGVTTGYYDNSYTLRVKYDAYVSYNGEDYNLVPNVSAYTFLDTSVNTLAQRYQNFVSADYLQAVACKAEYLSTVGGWVYGARDSYGDIVTIKLNPTIEAIGYFEQAFQQVDTDYDYLVNEFGLGHGWRLGFSAIERYIDSANEYYQYRLILTDGRAIKIDGNYLDYPLDDLQFSKSGNGYAGAAYTLTYADGKKEYFDSNGRNIAIVDKYGNEIKIEYTVSNSIVTSMKITDTVGNIIVFSDVVLDFGDKTYLQIPGTSGNSGRYNKAKTLTLNGDVIRTYYSYDTGNKNGVQLRVVRNEVGENTTITTNARPTDYNCFVSSPTTNDSISTRSSLLYIIQPNGLQLMFMPVNLSTVVVEREIIGYSGYQETDPISGITYNRMTGLNSYAREDYVNYIAGDYSGYYGIANLYTTTESLNHATAPMYIWNSVVNEYTFNNGGNLMRHRSIAYSGPPEDEFTGNFNTVTSLGTASITSYTYNTDFPLPSTASTQIYEPGNTSSYMTQGYSYTYDAKGNVTRQTLPNGQSITYTYHSSYNMPLTTTYKQDANTTIVETNTLTSDNKSIANTVITSNGTTVSKTAFTYDTKGRVTAISTYSSASDYSTQQLAYGNQAQVTQITTSGIKTADGENATATPNSAAGTIVEKTTYNTRGWPISYTDANGKTTSITYDATGRITGVTYPDGGRDSYVYDSVLGTVTYTDAANNVFVYKYDYFGNLTEIYDNTNAQALVTYAYDSFGRKTLETIHSTDSTKDQITYWDYDNLGRVVEVGFKNSAGTKTALETYVYQANLGKTTHTVLGSGNAPNYVETSYIDNMGNTTKTGRMLNSTEYVDSYTYDYLGNCTQYKSAYTTAIGGSFTEKYTYDYAGNVLSVTDALNNIVRNTYDWQGKATQYKDAKGNTTHYTYDKLGRLIKTTTPIDAANSHVVKYYYDPAGNIVKQLTSSGTTAGTFDTVEYSYDTMGRLTSAETPLNGTTAYASAYTYDLMGNLLSARYGNTITISGSNETVTQSPSVVTYTYDHLGNMLTETNALSKAETYTYDLNGNVLTKLDRNGVTTQYVYDNRGRLTGETIGTGTGAINHSYTYALNGLLLSEALGSDTVSYAYDALSRLITETQGTQVKRYTYNIGDLATAFTVTASGSSVMNSSYGYDALGRMTQMSGSGGASASAAYTYDANSNPLTVTYGNGVQHAYTYNAGNLITQLTASKGSTSLLNKAYTYDLAGRQLGFTDANGTTSYGYDALGQLVTESRTGTNAYTRSYTYDSRGNRTAMTADGVNTSYSYNAANQLTGSSGPASIAYTYDNAGNLLTESTGGTVSAQYTYNADNQLTGVQSGTTRYTYTYHPNGLRKTKATYNASNVLQSSTTYTWSGDALVMETVGSTNKRYFYGIDLVAGTSGTAATTNYFTHDAHGSVTLTTNTSGTAVQPYEYDAFGKLLNPASSDSNPFRYSGEYFDSETGNYYLRARYYDPTVGRFTQQDTHWKVSNLIYGDDVQTTVKGMEGFATIPQILAIKQAGNRYGYCANDPINYIDSSGEFAATLAILVGVAYVLVTGTITMFYLYDVANNIVPYYYYSNSVINFNKASDADVEADDADIESQTSIEDILEDAQKGRETKGKTQQWNKSGGYGKALDDYNKLNPHDSRDIQTQYGPGKSGTLSDGSKVNVRPGSSSGDSTLEIQRPNGKRIKIRYGF